MPSLQRMVQLEHALSLNNSTPLCRTSRSHQEHPLHRVQPGDKGDVGGKGIENGELKIEN